MVTRPFDAATDGFYGAGTILRMVLSPAGFRDNIDPTSGPEGLRGTWTYHDETGEIHIPVSYPPNTTVQLGVRDLLGFDPEPAALLEFSIQSGSGRVFVSRNHNLSNDPARDEMEPTDSSLKSSRLRKWIEAVDRRTR